MRLAKLARRQARSRPAAANGIGRGREWRPQSYANMGAHRSDPIGRSRAPAPIRRSCGARLISGWPCGSSDTNATTKPRPPPARAGPPTLTSAKKGEPKSKVPNTSGPVLEFQHIGRDSNQDVYECLAQNAHGVSAPADVKLNVLFAPAVLNSSHSESVLVGSQAQLACLFEGNPQPEIRWFYTDPLSKSASTLQLDNDRKSALTIKNVTYRNEGDYFCEARNYINGQAYSVRSSNILLDVFGEPQFLVKVSRAL